ncbi:glycosyltransferase [Litorisediminicola beolgyonensis]|uniref:Glycosyltransferase n=1 Tax=Litorisediminicola beolgyonensis TaxID=1173614 RepID=A0ABW3ZGS6_9RHOB
MTEPNLGLSIIIPASNEAALIRACLRSLVDQHWTRTAPVEVVVVANGCSDDTAKRARAFTQAFSDRGWHLHVVERGQGGKIGALNAGDAVARGGMRVYLDADVVLAADLLDALADALAVPQARYASGRIDITAPSNLASRAYARMWRRVPFMAEGVPGCGLFAVNAAGRMRWGAFPDVASDDTYVRLLFAPEERIAVSPAYLWPVVEGLSALVRVRRRQDRGVAEIAERYPELVANEGKPHLPLGRKLAMALRDPVGFAVYSGVALAARMGRDDGGWSRGR